MDKVATWLWANGTAEEQAAFYTALIPDSRIVTVTRAPAANPGTAEGAVLVVAFALAGRSYALLNGGPQFVHSEAASLQILCDDQAEVDRYWTALTADGGTPGECGWLRDRWGLSWQVVPRRMIDLLNDPDRGRAARAMEAMMTMGRLDIAAIEAAAAGDAA